METMNKLGLQMTGRTCEELFKYGLKQSGTWPIDPDGDDYGYPAIDVYCVFESKTSHTYVDLKCLIVYVSKCTSLMCFTDRQTIVGSPKFSKFESNADLSFQMSYGVPLKQIEELIRLSESCTQEFQWDCYFAPLEIRGDKLLTWTDRSGKLIHIKLSKKLQRYFYF